MVRIAQVAGVALEAAVRELRRAEADLAVGSGERVPETCVLNVLMSMRDTPGRICNAVAE